MTTTGKRLLDNTHDYGFEEWQAREIVIMLEGYMHCSTRGGQPSRSEASEHLSEGYNIDKNATANRS